MSVLGFNVSWQIGGEAHGDEALEEMAAAFERAGAEFVSFGRHIWPQLIPVFEKYTAAQFDAEGSGPVIGPWQELSEAYAAWKATAFPGQPILVATGAMKSGLTDSSSPFAYRLSQDDRLDYGTRGLEYASLHQTGAEFLPTRPPWDFPPDMQRELQQAAMAGLREALEQSGVTQYATLTEDEAAALDLPIEIGPKGGRFVTRGWKKSYIRR